MKKMCIILILGLFLVSFAFAENETVNDSIFTNESLQNGTSVLNQTNISENVSFLLFNTKNGRIIEIYLEKVIILIPINPVIK